MKHINFIEVSLVKQIARMKIGEFFSNRHATDISAILWYSMDHKKIDVWCLKTPFVWYFVLDMGQNIFHYMGRWETNDM